MDLATVCESERPMPLVDKGVNKNVELVCLEDSDKEEEGEEECGICLENLQDVATLSSCIHKFCFKCINQWMLRNNVCPFCKKEFESITRIVDGKPEITLCEKKFHCSVEIIRSTPSFIGRRIDRDAFLRTRRYLNLDIFDSDTD